jgi:hypothetical protein
MGKKIGWKEKDEILLAQKHEWKEKDEIHL